MATSIDNNDNIMRHPAHHVRTHFSLPKQQEYYRECEPDIWRMALARMGDTNSPLHPEAVLQKNEPFVHEGKLHVDHLDTTFDDFRSPEPDKNPPNFACLGCHFFRGLPYAGDKNDKGDPAKRLRPHIQHWTRHGCHYMNLYVVMCDLLRSQTIREQIQHQSTIFPIDQLDTDQLQSLQLKISNELSRRQSTMSTGDNMTAPGGRTTVDPVIHVELPSNTTSTLTPACADAPEVSNNQPSVDQPSNPTLADQGQLQADIARGIWRARIENQEAASIFHRVANARKFIARNQPHLDTKHIRNWKQVREVLLKNDIVPDATDPEQQDLCEYFIGEAMVM